MIRLTKLFRIYSSTLLLTHTMRLMQCWSSGLWAIPAVLLSVSVACAAGQAIDSSVPNIRIVIGDKADQLERFAASELEGILEKLFAVSASVGTTPDTTSSAVVLLGQPESNPALKQAIGDQWSQLSDQDLLLRRLYSNPSTLVVSGGGPGARCVWR